MLNINNSKIITTQKDLEEINNIGCIICKCNSFYYYNNYHLYKCINCESVYAIDSIGIINMLELPHDTIRVYKKANIIDDDEKDFQVEYKSKLVKRKQKTSSK